MKTIRKIETTEETIDMKGMTIPKGTTLHVIKEGPKHPTLGYKILVVRVDNGTGHLELMPETAIKEEVKQ